MKNLFGLDGDARQLLIQAAESDCGVKLEGRLQKRIARDLEAAGWAKRNKSGTHLEARPAGRFIVGRHPAATGNDT